MLLLIAHTLDVLLWCGLFVLALILVCEQVNVPQYDGSAPKSTVTLWDLILVLLPVFRLGVAWLA